MSFLLHLLSIFATTPTEKAELAVGKIVIKWAQRGLLYFEGDEGKQDIAVCVELAKDLGATGDTAVVTLPATATHPETTYVGGRPSGTNRGGLMLPGT